MMKNPRRGYWIYFCSMSVLIVLFATKVQAQQFGGTSVNNNNDNHDEESNSNYYASILAQSSSASKRNESLSFDRGGTRPRCWNATGLQTLFKNTTRIEQEEHHVIYQAAEMAFKEECSATPGDMTQLLVQVLEETTVMEDDGEHTPLTQRSWSSRNNKSPKQRLTAAGWEMSPEHEFKIFVSGTWEKRSLSHNNNNNTLEDNGSIKAAIVVQLCPVGMNSQCPPLIPLLLPAPADDENMATSSPLARQRRRQQRTRRRRSLQPGSASFDGDALLGTLVDFEFISLEPEEGGAFAGELSLSGAPAGTYSLLGSVVVFGPNLQFDGASIIPLASNKEQLITVLEEDGNEDDADEDLYPYSVDDAAVNFVIALSVVGGSVVLYLFIQFYRQRKSQVFELTQGKFILAMLLCGLIATCSIVLVQHKNDLYCELYQPLITLPMHIMFAILVGRMWRIRAIISPLLLLTLDKKEHWTTKWVNLVERITRLEGLGERVKSRDKKIRRKISDGQLVRVIALMCVPQVIVQILLLTIGDQEFIIKYDETIDSSDGEKSVTAYETCKNTYFSNALGILSFTFLVLLFVTLLILAGTSRNMPSLFSETKSMFSVAITTLRMTFLSLMLVLATLSYPNASTVQYLVFALLVGVTIVHTCIRITWPKLAMAQSGSKIVVSKLIAAHNEECRKSKSIMHQNNSGESSSYSTSYGLYGGSMLTGISLPSTMTTASAQTASTASRWQSNNSSPSDSKAKTKLVMLQEEDGEESSGSMRALKEGRSRKEEPTIAESSQTPEGETSDDDHDAQSSDSSVVLVETQLKESISGFSLFSNGTINRTRHSPIQRQSVATGGTNDNNTSFASFGWNTSDISLNSRFMDMTPEPTGDDAGDTRPQNARGLSLRGPFQDPIATQQSPSPDNNLDIEDRKPSGQAATPASTEFRNGGMVKQFSLRFLRGPGNGGKSSNRGQPTTHSTIPLSIECNPKHASGKIRVTEDDAPPRRLLLRMIDVHRRLGKVNKMILAGLCVDVQSWEEIREACSALGDVFANEVEFEWRTQPQEEENLLQEFNDSGEVKLEETLTPDSIFSPQMGGRGMNKKQLSWKPGLIAASSESHLEDGTTTALPSILRHSATGDIAEEEEGSDLSSTIDDEHGNVEQTNGSPAGPTPTNSEVVETKEDINERERKVSEPPELSRSSSLTPPERNVSERNIRTEAGETSEGILTELPPGKEIKRMI